MTALSNVFARIFPVRWKRFGELHYWKRRTRAEGTLSNAAYKDFYTTHFGLDDRDFSGKVVLDIGCGPRGSLEWASMAARRIGLDPLAADYLKLGADRHRMEYIASGSENIPLPDASCDIVCTFNSLDHVDDVERTIVEIKRVTRTGGVLLLLVEVNHPPTVCEPHFLTPASVVRMLEPEFQCEVLEVYEAAGDGMYQSVREKQRVPDPLNASGNGWLSARFLRRST